MGSTEVCWAELAEDKQAISGYKDSLNQTHGKDHPFSAQPAHGCREGDPGVSVDNAPQISDKERAKLPLRRKGVDKCTLHAELELQGLSCPPPLSHGDGTCEGFVPAKAPKREHGEGVQDVTSVRKAPGAGIQLTAPRTQAYQFIMKTWQLLPWEAEEAKSRSEKLLDKATTQDTMI